jgi:hypothetical protein
MIRRRLILTGALAAGFPVRAFAQPLPKPAPAGKAASVLFITGTSVGNGADTTEDALQSFTLPAGILANVGDMIRITAGGSAGGTTDAKLVRIRLGSITGTIVANPTLNVATMTRWSAIVALVKTGPNAQSYAGNASLAVGGSASGALAGPATLTDTAPIQIIVTGQNNTNPVAGSVLCTFLSVEFIGGSGP